MGSSPVAFKYFFFIFFRFASFFVFILDFVHNWIRLFEFGMCLCNKYSTVNNFNNSQGARFLKIDLAQLSSQKRFDFRNS